MHEYFLDAWLSQYTVHTAVDYYTKLVGKLLCTDGKLFSRIYGLHGSKEQQRLNLKELLRHFTADRWGRSDILH